MDTLRHRTNAQPPPQEDGNGVVETDYVPHRRPGVSTRQLFKGLSWLDRLLSILILLSMIIGVVIGKYLLPNTPLT